MFELMNFGCTWTTCINYRAKETRFPCNIIKVQFVYGIVKCILGAGLFMISCLALTGCFR